jgi:hypothetical protein
MNNRKNSKGANRIVSEGHQQQLLRKKKQLIGFSCSSKVFTEARAE